MNIKISAASEQPESFLVREALSEYPFYRFTCKMDNFDTMNKVTLTADDKSFEGTLSGMDVSIDATGSLLYNVGAVDSRCPAYDEVHPISFRDTPIKDIIAHYGFQLASDGLVTEMSLLNFTHSDADMILTLANLGATPAFVDFVNKKVMFLNQLYKQDPVEVMAGFQAMYSKPVSIGFTLSDTTSATFGGSASPNAVLEGGRPIAQAAGTMRNLVKNYNDLAKLWSRKQMFSVTDQDIPVGSMVISALTEDKRLIVAKEAVYTVRGARFTYWVV